MSILRAACHRAYQKLTFYVDYQMIEPTTANRRWNLAYIIGGASITLLYISVASWPWPAFPLLLLAFGVLTRLGWALRERPRG